MDGTGSTRTPTALAALIVQGGRQHGTMRILGQPSTLIGQATGSDIRLNYVEIESHHCLIVQGAQGFHLRDLQSAIGTLVNGKRVSSILLNDGDLVEVGPFQFRVQLPSAAVEVVPDQLRSAMRIQVAAVAAQQAALDEEETRLQQRRSSLAQQEEQLANHLEEKRRQLQRGSQRNLTERENWLKEKAEQEKELETLGNELAQAQTDLARDQHKLLAERQRLQRVSQRIRHRIKHHSESEQAKIQASYRQLEEAKLIIEQRLTAILAQEAKISGQVVHTNTDRELLRRQLETDQQALLQHQQRWRRRRSREKEALRLRQQNMLEAEQKHQQARALLLQEKHDWERTQHELQQELHGLNNRVVHQREKIREQQAEVDRLTNLIDQYRIDAAVSAVFAESNSPPESLEVDSPHEEVTPILLPAIAGIKPESGVNLVRLAEDLADQRSHLIEQWDRLVRYHQDWHAQNDRAAGELEQLAQLLSERERELNQRGQAVESIEIDTKLHQEAIGKIRQQIHAWRCRLQAHEQSLEIEKQQLMSSIHLHEHQLESQRGLLTRLQSEWDTQRRSQVESLRREQVSLQSLHQELARLRLDYYERSSELESEKRTLSERAISIENYRQEVLQLGNDPEANDRLERLRQRWLSQNAAQIRSAKRERESLYLELVNVDARHAELIRKSEQLVVLESGLAEKHLQLQEQEIRLAQNQEVYDREIRQSDSQRQLAEKRLRLLEEELERMARDFIDEEGPPLLPFAA